MANVRRNSTGNTNAPEPLPQRWGLILTASALAGWVAFLAGGPLAAFGIALVVVGTLHTILA
ncbi:hypothetical protein [Streptomyces amritsarensis]|uniref:hypothetical protein n=1 Tax=Streptomyces amritsarensis TaxID=681158 RepID=UPI00117DA176|nr:hypothetical protein [Streptomyces amritsarensis]